MHKSRLEAPGSAMWSTQVANWLQTLQTDVTRLWRRVPQVPDPALGIVPEYRPDGTGGGDSSPQVVRFRNDDTTDAPAFGVMQITGAVIDATSGERVVTVIQPDHFGSQYAVLVNGAEPVTPGELGNAQLLGGPVAALYNVGDGTPAQGEIWGPRAGDWLLRKDTGGFEICGNPSGGSVMVNHAPWLTFRGVTAGTLGYGSVQDVTVYMADTSTGETVQVYNKHHNIQSGTEVVAVWTGTRFEVANAGTKVMLCKTVAAIAKGGTGEVVIYNSSGTSTGVTITAKAVLGAIGATKWCYVTSMDDGAYHITNGEC